MNAHDRVQKISDRVRWAEAMLNVMIADRDLETMHVEAIAGIAGHLDEAGRELQELYEQLPNEPAAPEKKKPRIVPIRKTAPADAEPEQGGAA